MDIRQIAPNYFAAPQIDPADMDAIRAAGIVHIICNRPDVEIPPSHHAEVMRRAAEEAGLTFTYLELTHQTMTLENAHKQRDLVAGCDGPVLAYCASGTRSTIVWCIGQAGRMETDEIIASAARGGYELSHLAPTLNALAEHQD